MKGGKGCGHNGKHSKVLTAKYAEGGAVQPLTNPASGPFAQGTNKYLSLIQQRRADARAQFGATKPADVVGKYFPAPPAAPATPASGASAERQPRGDGGQRAAGFKSGGGGGGGGSFASSKLSARLPGGVDTRNPSSGFNTAAAKMTSGPQKAPTASSRPKANPKR